jgi:hypothetical protein
VTEAAPVDPNQTRQDEALRAIVVAEAAAADDFMTATSNDGTTVFHNGFGQPTRQRTIPLAILNGLERRGLIEKTRFIDQIDFGFAVTEAGREYISRLDHGGISAIEAETQRADRAEAALAAAQAAAVDAERDERERRRKRADRLGTVVAAVVVVLVGVALFFASEATGLRIFVGIATFAGLAGVSVRGPVKRVVSDLTFRALTFLHEHS